MRDSWIIPIVCVITGLAISLAMSLHSIAQAIESLGG